jgi:hypothetical protein
MKHSKKYGKAINDKNMKFVKKLIKKNPITFTSSISTTNDCEVTITNIRKYQNLYTYKQTDKFVYEVDIKVKLNYKSRYQYDRDNRRINNRVRGYRMENLIREELCYFNIVDICISKISYE